MIWLEPRNLMRNRTYNQRSISQRFKCSKELYYSVCISAKYKYNCVNNSDRGKYNCVNTHLN